MSTLEEETFLRLLTRIDNEEYSPNLGERAVLYRAFNSTLNPLGIYFAFVGAVGGFMGMSYTRKPSWRAFGALLGSLYSFEVSWGFQGHQPCFSFFNDIRSVDGQVRDKAGECHASGHLSRSCLSLRGIVFDFFTLDRTAKWLYTVVFAPAGRARWFTHFRMEWLEGLPIDPLTLWYWRFAVSQAARR
ncbi:hypothetical protein DQ04_01181020 [Trypanosoma grayi]|uniref:hypothetical protein n=1 Tax=Trypanosoma grayi TaxID=71804 RepID=UPI0004F4A975|nr:hypothetical protein DQ04_01181020 [Trypanosoma grayi]KEG13148.1 hypothetical protein DQ04_01181020 [Trypanosoma grayi]